ncbi:MAG: amidohydrolase family protein [Rhodospirillaceae bacterium]
MNREPRGAGLQSPLSTAKRRILGGLVSGATAAAPGGMLLAQTGKPHRIDIHHHIVSPGYSAALKERGQRHAQWSLEKSLEDMDKHGIATAVTSLIQPAVWFGDVPLGRRLAREANEYAAQLARDHRGRFGVFATLPLPDAEGSLAEIAYALDTLKAEGFCLMTSYNARYLGDAAFRPVLEELNRRAAVVYTHPLNPECCGAVNDEVPPQIIEYAVDTTRTMASLLFSGAAAKYPDIRWIFSHSGGVTPFLLSRFTYQESVMAAKEEKLPKGLMYELKKFYYDTAQGNHAGALAALLKIAPVSQLLYGTDFPFRTGAEVNAGLAHYGFSPAELLAIERDNALRLLPSLKR